MKIAVIGLEHLGAVTATCLSSMGHDVLAFGTEEQRKVFYQDPDSIEPGLSKYEQSRFLNLPVFTLKELHLIKNCDIVWICYDTPVSADGTANVAWVTSKMTEEIFPHLGSNTVVLISSQLPVGTTDEMAKWFREHRPTHHQNIHVAYSPENLRHGDAIDRFLHPDRVVFGTDNLNAITVLRKIFDPPNLHTIWTGIKEAEMIKHAINCFLATEIAFINEVDTICTKMNIDADVVAKGLMTDKRIGKLAYLKPGGPYTHKTLGRDINYLWDIGNAHSVESLLIWGVHRSNERRKNETQA